LEDALRPRRVGAADEKLDPLAGGEQNVLQLNGLLEQTSIAPHLQQRVSGQREAIKPASRCVDHAPPLHFPASNGERRHHVAVDEEHRTLASILFVDTAMV